jgi:hypothetical protein
MTRGDRLRAASSGGKWASSRQCCSQDPDDSVTEEAERVRERIRSAQPGDDATIMLPAGASLILC